MESEFKFNDEFAAPKIEAFVAIEIGRHIITADQIAKVKEILEI